MDAMSERPTEAHSEVEISPGTPDDTFASGLQVCFEVLLYLSSRLARLKPGETLEFISTDADADETIPDWCDQRGYTLLSHDVLPDGRRRYLIRK